MSIEVPVLKLNFSRFFLSHLSHFQHFFSEKSVSIRNMFLQKARCITVRKLTALALSEVLCEGSEMEVEHTEHTIIPAEDMGNHGFHGKVGFRFQIRRRINALQICQCGAL